MWMMANFGFVLCKRSYGSKAYMTHYLSGWDERFSEVDDGVNEDMVRGTYMYLHSLTTTYLVM